MIGFAQKLRAIERIDLNRLKRRETCFHKQFEFAMIAKTGNVSANTSWIEACQQRSSGFHKRAFKFHFAWEHHGPWACFVFGDAFAVGLVGLARVVTQHIENLLRLIRTRWHKLFKHRERRGYSYVVVKQGLDGGLNFRATDLQLSG